MKYMPLEKLTPMVLEIDRRDLTNRVKTSFTSVGNEAGSPGVSSQLTHHFNYFQCRMVRQRSLPSGLTKPRLPV